MRLRWLLCVASVGALALGLSSCGGSDSANTPPEPVIDSPAAGASFKAGDTLRIEVSASDTQDGMLPASSLTWWVDFHHDTHTHPFVQRTQGTGGTASVPTRGETSDNVWLRIHVRATDSAGVIAEVTRDLGSLGKETIDSMYVPITTSELRYICRHWGQLEKLIAFYVAGNAVKAPWEEEYLVTDCFSRQLAACKSDWETYLSTRSKKLTRHEDLL